MEEFRYGLYRLIGSRIKNARRDKELSQLELSKKIDVSRASISNIEIGRQQPPLHILYELASALEIDIQFFLPTSNEIQKKIDSTSLSEVLKKEDLNKKSQKEIEDIINNLKDDI